ncbi:MAG: GNAT family N-acetyltransferase [Sodalinema sp.]|uniref:GNAT family N-acetyltransferase n=1 Tax=Sodalinema sp. TaxID=3080550 RepID=UPI0011F62935|nr:MAG: GNAT family N-acetyltransferase [Phormidium sp. SL48-SHIP]
MSEMTDPAAPVRFQQIRSSQDPATAAALAIYEEAFPLSEQIPRSQVEERIDRGIYELWVGQRTEEVIFMAILYTLRDSDLVLLGYIATQKAARNQGIGSRFFQQVLAALQERDRYLLLEVESPTEADPITRRRYGFYQRLGAMFLQDVRYILPPLSGGEPTEMCLAIAPGYKMSCLDGDRVRQLLCQLFQEVYDRPLSDPLLQTCLQDVPETVYLI